MPLTEEVDEINEYLKARRKKQELGELPRQDLTPSFVKRMSNALFGEKTKPKVPLQSMQPTYASPVAQSAVRKQLDEIMQERTTKPNPPSAPTRVAVPSSPKPLPPIPRYPESNVWTSAAKPSVTLPPKPAPIMNMPALVSAPAAKTASNSPWGFWNKTPAPKPTAPAPSVSVPSRPPAPVSTPIVRAPTPVPSALAPAAPSVASRSAFPSYSSIAAAPPKPYQDIPALSSKESASPANKTFDPISSVRTPLPASASPPMTPSSPVRAESAPVAPPVRAGYAPPWVTRTVPKPGITPALPSKQKQIMPITVPAQLEIASPASSPQNNSPVQTTPVGSREENPLTPPAFSPRGKPWVTGVLPKEAGEDFVPVHMAPLPSSNTDEKRPDTSSRSEQPSPQPVAFSGSGSGEVRVDELNRTIQRKQTETTPPIAPSDHDAALNEELSEEEAIDRLPFDEVEGLSESDLAYLERKEKEHAQTHDEALDQGDPAALRSHLEEQSQKLQASPAHSIGEDPKKEILRRLKKMMEENTHSP